MINQQLLEYISQQLSAGVSKEEISKALVSSGWQIGDINEAFTVISSPATQSVAVSHKGMWTIVIILLVFVGIGGALAAYSYVPSIVPTAITTSAPTIEATTTQSVVPTETSSVSPITKGLSNTSSSANGTASIPSATTSPFRSLAYDNAIKSLLGNIQVVAEIYYYGSIAPGPVKPGANSYGVPGKSCNTIGSVFADSTIKAAISGAQDKNGGALGYGGTPPTCNNSSTAYAVSSKLFSSRTSGVVDYWCVDSAGAASISTTALGSATVCPASN